MATRVDRRDFLRLSALAGGSLLAAPALLRQGALASPPPASTTPPLWREGATSVRLAMEAVASDNRGVGGLMMHRRTGTVIREGRNGR